ncbi:hypothetical protein [Lapidilactobacillus gannanensis]|jgi:hypothetical protein|uniref:Uncharacterized protein n=1 Tax=Lapidilactobacillus gannanensis TaxID=2486002 RepID=A0ABW4BL87_9LACO|nr:hypothetical protein [Lapidilactobacillus gannanensis]MCH4057368.1 hypothetical protein [Lactobacillaceae bacterium]
MFNRNSDHDHTLTLLIASLIWIGGAYLLINDYLKNHLLNGPMALVLLIGVVLTALGFWQQRKK